MRLSRRGRRQRRAGWRSTPAGSSVAPECSRTNRWWCFACKRGIAARRRYGRFRDARGLVAFRSAAPVRRRRAGRSAGVRSPVHGVRPARVQRRGDVEVAVVAVPPAGRHAPRSGRARRPHDAARAAAVVSRAGHRRAGRARAGRRGPARGLARRHRRRDRRFRDRARDHRGRRRARLLRALGATVAIDVGRALAGTGRRRARHPTVVLDRQRQRVLVSHRTGSRRRVDDRRRGRRPRSARRAGRRGAARLVVVSARGAASVRHRRVGRPADRA